MATNVTIFGDITYKTATYLQKALDRLTKGGWIKDGKWNSSENDAVSVMGFTLLVPLATYTNLDRMFDQSNDTLLEGASSYELRLDHDGQYLQEIYSAPDSSFVSIELDKCEYLHRKGYSKKDIEFAAHECGSWVAEEMTEGVLNGFRHLLKSKAA